MGGDTSIFRNATGSLGGGGLRIPRDRQLEPQRAMRFSSVTGPGSVRHIVRKREPIQWGIGSYKALHITWRKRHGPLLRELL